MQLPESEMIRQGAENILAFALPHQEAATEQSKHKKSLSTTKGACTYKAAPAYPVH